VSGVLEWLDAKSTDTRSGAVVPVSQDPCERRGQAEQIGLRGLDEHRRWTILSRHRRANTVRWTTVYASHRCYIPNLETGLLDRPLLERVAVVKGQDAAWSVSRSTLRDVLGCLSASSAGGDPAHVNRHRPIRDLGL